MTKVGFLQSFERILAWPFMVRQKSLAKHRTPMSQSEFISTITRSGGDADAAGLIYAKLQDWICNDNYTPYPGDSLSSVFGIAEEELDEDIILDVLIKLGLSPPSRQMVKAFGPIDTATDVARFVALARSSTKAQP